MHGCWNTVLVDGKSVDCYDPAGADRPRFALLFLHDENLETCAGRTAFSQQLDTLGMACACPHGKRSWWADRICAEFDEQTTAERHVREAVFSAMRARWRLSPRAIGLLGLGMGGQGVLRLAFKFPEQFPSVAALAPALDYHEVYGRGTPLDEMYDCKEQCRQDTALLHIHPSKFPPHIFFGIDPDDALWFRGNDRLHEKLTALGVPHEFDFTSRAGGSSWAYFDRQAERALRFLHAGLELESRRLI
jgi:pimeloyl-ACP methyl ester carboxylesterase